MPLFRSHLHEAAELAAMNPLGRVMKGRDVNAWLPCRVHDSLNCDQCQVLRFDCARFIHEFGHYAGEKCIDPEPLYEMKSGFCSCVAACFARLCCCIPECTDIYNSVQQSHYCITREYKNIFRDVEYKKARQAGMPPLEEILVVACNACNEAIAQSDVYPRNVVCCSGIENIDAQLETPRKAFPVVLSASTKFTALLDQGVTLRFLDKQDISNIDNATAKNMFEGAALKVWCRDTFRGRPPGNIIRFTPSGCFIVEFHWPGLFSRNTTGAGTPADAANVSVAVASVAIPKQTQPSAPPLAASSVEERLRKLKNLLRNGLIDEDDYMKKKQAILDTL